MKLTTTGMVALLLGCLLIGLASQGCGHDEDRDGDRDRDAG